MFGIGIRGACLWLALSVYSLTSSAREPLDLGTLNDYSLSEHIEMYVEENSVLSLDEVMQVGGEHWDSDPNFGLNLREDGRPVWFRAKLKNLGQADQWVIDLKTTFAVDMTFHLLIDSTLRQTQHVNGYESFNQRPIPSRFAVFSFDINEGATVELYFRLNRAMYDNFGFQLIRKSEYVESENVQIYLHALQHGFMLALFLYHLIIFFSIRDLSYILYSLFLGTCLLYNLTMNGFGFQYLWPNAPSLGSYFFHPMAGLVMLSAGLFAVSFLRLHELSRRFTIVLVGMTLINLVVSLLAVSDPQLAVELLPLTASACYLGALLAGVYAYKKRRCLCTLFCSGMGHILCRNHLVFVERSRPGTRPARGIRIRPGLFSHPDSGAGTRTGRPDSRHQGTATVC